MTWDKFTPIDSFDGQQVDDADDASYFDSFEHDIDEEEVARLVSDLDMHKDLPIADAVSNGPLDFGGLPQAEGYNAWYRGWYGNVWCPKQSKFRGRGGRHKGVDLASATGTTWENLINYCRIQWNPSGGSGKWGNHIFENFRWNDGKDYTFVYAHLQSVVGKAPRTINGRFEALYKSDCTGNAGGPGMYCGTDNACQRRSDHVHIELHKKGVGVIDPIAWLGWNVRWSDDNSCVSCTK